MVRVPEEQMREHPNDTCDEDHHTACFDSIPEELQELCF